MSAQPIPKPALDHHIAFVGKTGSGKTGSAKSGIVEPALRAEERVCVIDPTGAWWGLRLDADGKSKGLPIYVFGGDHGDFPLLATQGEMIAEAIGESSTSAILDTTRLKTGERMRFFTDFADTILRVNRGPLRLVIDECHLFAPQAGTRGGGAMPDMLHAANNLISLGRSRGLRIVLISQRPAKVHKDSLTQVESLVAMRLIAPQDRKAVEEWISDQADRDTGKEIISSLPSLKTGEAWVWSPEAGYLKRVTFPKPSTYDSSKVQGSGTAKRLSPIDVEKLQAQFAKVKAEAEAKDPKALQRRIAELEAAAKRAPAIDPKAVEEAEKRGFERGKAAVIKEAQRVGQRVVVSALTDMQKLIKTMVVEISRASLPVEQAIGAGVKTAKLAFPDVSKDVQFQPAAPAPRPVAPRMSAMPAERQVAKEAAPATGSGSLPGPQQRILNSLATWKQIGEQSPSNAQVAWLAGYSPSSSSYKNPRSALNTAGLLTYPSGDLVAITTEGEAVACPIQLSGSLLDFVLSNLPGPEARILKSIASHYPNAIDNAAAADGANYSPTSSSYKNPRSAIRTKDLITYPSGDQVRAADWLFAA